MKIGLIGLVNDQLKADPFGTFAMIASIGYKGVENASVLLEGDVQANLARYLALGLETIAHSASFEQLRDDVDTVIANARALQVPYVVCYWRPMESREQIMQDAAVFNHAGEKIRAAGMKLCYHNHDHEFRKTYGGVYALDLLASATDPDALYFLIDIAWVTMGGEDPVRLLERLAGRVPYIHVKDFADLSDRDSFTAIGTGKVKIQQSLHTARQLGVEWAVVEQDHTRNLTAWETVTLSYLYLKEAKLV